MAFDAEAIRAEFPILGRQVNGKPLVYLDSAASAQKPRAVIGAMTRAMEHSYANVHRGLHTLANETTEAYEAARTAVAGFLGAYAAEVDAKPELEIYADDVACAHGNTVGSLDEDALFYMRARGMPEPEARALLMEAFVGEVVDRIRHEGARRAVHAWVSDKLRALS